MKIDVFDSYAKSKSGHLMHFDVLVRSGTSQETAFEYGQSWLVEIGEEATGLEINRCNFCHTEQAAPFVENSIAEKGYFILQMQGCPEPIL